MIVFHAIWEYPTSARLHIWAESSHLPVSVARRSGRQPRAQKPDRHPFALASDELKEALAGLEQHFAFAVASDEALDLHLPSTSRGPGASPELIREDLEEVSPTAFKVWTTTTVALDARQSLNFLLALPDRPAPGLVVGSSLRFWVTVARFAFELLTRQAYTPALQEVAEKDGLAYQAVWEAVLASGDAERLATLARAMPASCRARVSRAAQGLAFPREMVLHFLDRTIDAFVREHLSPAGLLSGGNSRKKRSDALPEQWLRALASDHPALVSSARELKEFAGGLRGWLDQIRPGQKVAAFRTCFRLDPPSSEEGKEDTDWLISFHLQANDDRSLLVPAEQVWKERSSTLTFLKRTFENPQERLLADLGRASRLFPALEEGLRTARPSALQVNTEQAYAFLREAAPLLEQSGFGVLVPPWWQKRAARLGVKLKVKPQASANTASGLLGLNNLVSYDWTVSVGDTALSPAEFEKLVRLKLPLIKVRGQWVELRPEEIERAIAFFQKKHRNSSMTLGEALRTGLGQEQAESGLPVLNIEGEGWISTLLAQISGDMKFAQIEVPTTFQGKLRPYQLKGVSWLAFLGQFGLGGCLADDMGLGKTIQLITLLLYERREKLPVAPTLLICPMSIVGNWQREIGRFAPSLKPMVHHGHERLSGEAFLAEVKQHDIVITTYALALRDREHLSSLDWEYVVVDEAQNIKNEAAKQTQAIKNLPAAHRIALTGTPVENRLSELWSIMDFLNPGYLGSAPDFRKEFALPIEHNHNAERAEILKQVIQPFVLRRLKTDKTVIADLPDKMEMKVFCNLTQEQASLYEAVVKEMMEKIEQADGIERKGLVLATLLKLKQICNHPAQFLSDSSRLLDRSGKLARLEEMLQEVLAAGDKALVFSQFAEMGTLLRHFLQEQLGCEVLFLHGGTPKKQRDLLVRRFQEDRRGAPVFILSLKAGGVGLNLTAANHVFHFDRWWNPAVENQATDRAFRIGQRKNVQVHKFVCIGTLEERIDAMIEQKKELAESIIGSGENWLTEMSTTQLKELFSLSREAVGE